MLKTNKSQILKLALIISLLFFIYLSIGYLFCTSFTLSASRVYYCGFLAPHHCLPTPLRFFLRSIQSIQASPIAILVEEKTSWSEEQHVPGLAASLGQIVTGGNEMPMAGNQSTRWPAPPIRKHIGNIVMKKTLIALTIAGLGFAATAQAALEASAVATWQATAKKDTTSELVVTPLSSLSFQYAEGIKGFNTVNGLFDVAIKGDSSATSFTLKAKKLNGTLNHLGGDSTVDVGVLWGGA
ncbi:MAG: common pilus major fimbrillin subunit EcpA, partial [Shewanella sp.]